MGFQNAMLKPLEPLLFNPFFQAVVFFLIRFVWNFSTLSLDYFFSLFNQVVCSFSTFWFVQ
jgi:hypothetical protein